MVISCNPVIADISEIVAFIRVTSAVVDGLMSQESVSQKINPYRLELDSLARIEYWLSTTEKKRVKEKRMGMFFLEKVME